MLKMSPEPLLFVIASAAKEFRGMLKMSPEPLLFVIASAAKEFRGMLKMSPEPLLFVIASAAKQSLTPDLSATLEIASSLRFSQ